jgi:hypothetical protein
MTDDELDKARADEAWRIIHTTRGIGGIAVIAARQAPGA